jgi:hypothetical protein
MARCSCRLASGIKAFQEPISRREYVTARGAGRNKNVCWVRPIPRPTRQYLGRMLRLNRASPCAARRALSPVSTTHRTPAADALSPQSLDALPPVHPDCRLTVFDKMSIHLVRSPLRRTTEPVSLFCTPQLTDSPPIKKTEQKHARDQEPLQMGDGAIARAAGPAAFLAATWPARRNREQREQTQ